MKNDPTLWQKILIGIAVGALVGGFSAFAQDRLHRKVKQINAGK